jgi:hypothetical protein
MGERIGADFSNVRVHSDSQAAKLSSDLGAKAFTLGKDVYFGAEKYDTESDDGKKLLAHELTHVVQQKCNNDQNVLRLKPNPAEKRKNDLIDRFRKGATVDNDDHEKLKQLFFATLRIEGQIEGEIYRCKDQQVINRDQKIVSWASEVIGSVSGAIQGRGLKNVELPDVTNWDRSKKLIQQIYIEIDAGNLIRAAHISQILVDEYNKIHKKYQEYYDLVIGGAEQAQAALEVVRDVSFAIALAAGAAVAAPVVAAGAAGMGATGALGVAASGIGTGAITAGGGALLRGGSTALASAINDDEVNWKAVKEDAKRGGKEGLITGLSAGVGTGMGKAFGIGAQGLSRGSQIARSAMAGGTANAVGESVNAAIEGKSAGQILKAGAQGFGTGTLGGAAGVLGNAVKKPVVSKIIASGIGAGSSAAGTYLQGGELNDIISSAAIGGVSSLAIAGAAQPNQKLEQKAFQIGRDVRNKARIAVAAAMIGTSDAISPTGTKGTPFTRELPAIQQVLQENKTHSPSAPKTPPSPTREAKVIPLPGANGPHEPVTPIAEVPPEHIGKNVRVLRPQNRLPEPPSPTTPAAESAKGQATAQFEEPVVVGNTVRLIKGGGNDTQPHMSEGPIAMATGTKGDLPKIVSVPSLDAQNVPNGNTRSVIPTAADSLSSSNGKPSQIGIASTKKSSGAKPPRSTTEDIASVHKEESEGTGTASRSPSGKDELNQPDPQQVEEVTNNQSNERLGMRKVWEPPLGAARKPSLRAPLHKRVRWLRIRLKVHVDQAIERFSTEGFSPGQEAALERAPNLARAFRGSRIDKFAKESILQDPELAEIIAAPDFINEPDIIDSIFPTWFDITTRAQWAAHVSTYGRRYGTTHGVGLWTDVD